MDAHEKDYPASIMNEGDGKKVKRKTRQFSNEFKASAVTLLLDEGNTPRTLRPWATNSPHATIRRCDQQTPNLRPINMSIAV